MNLKDRILPYPVLGLNDDISSEVVPLNPSIHSGDDNYVVEWEIVVRDEDIMNLLKEGKAQYVCEIECQRTFFRKCVSQDDPHFRIEIAKNIVAGTIEFQNTISVKEPIREYTNRNLHEDYWGYSFNLESGDLLAYIGTFSFDADIRYEKLQAISSFMKIEQAGEEDTTTSIFLDDDRIKIRLPKDMFHMYQRVIGEDRRRASIIHSSLVFNALLQALYAFKGHGQYLWARTLEYRIQNDESLASYKTYVAEEDDEGDTPFDKERIYELAQSLLGDPYNRMFACLESFK